MSQRTRETHGDPAASWRANVWGKAAGEEREHPFRTPSGIELEPLYCHPSDPGAADGDFPGCFPYTRGIHPTMYRGRLWTMRQYAGFGSAADTNRRFRALLASGQTGLSTA